MVSGTNAKAHSAPPAEREPEELPPACGWDHEGDQCFAPVEEEGLLCPHHQRLAQEKGLVPKVTPPPPAKPKPKKAPRKAKAKKKEPEEIDVEALEPLVPAPPPMSPPEVAPEPPPLPKASPKRGPKVTPKEPLEERFERQKRILQRMTIGELRHGAEHGLNKLQVRALHEALIELGWIPKGVRVDV